VFDWINKFKSKRGNRAIFKKNYEYFDLISQTIPAILSLRV
jgi:hypothetical protein